jgi:hypothetical protein
MKNFTPEEIFMYYRSHNEEMKRIAKKFSQRRFRKKKQEPVGKFEK